VLHQSIIAKTWRENILFSAMIELTYSCDLKCFFCFNDLDLKGLPLSTEQYLQLLRDLAGMQVMNLILTGGEPLAHPDFFTIGRTARELGFVVRVKSNGHALRGELAQRLKEEVDPFVVEISLHGGCAATHDRQTRVPGSFERLMENLPELGRLGLRLKLNAVLTRWNEDEVEAMLGLADSLSLPLAINPTVSPEDNGDQSPLDIAPSLAGRARLFRLLAERAEQAASRDHTIVEGNRQSGFEGLATVGKNCGAGVSGVTIDPCGNVLPCVQWRRPLGNLHTQSIAAIWSESAALAEVRRLNAAASQMVDAHGARGRLLTFCPGLAQALTGNPLAIYDAAGEQMELLDPLTKPKSCAPHKELWT
jgi:radical SAM protein with 4Fe4S-binding SPASM domain